MKKLLTWGVFALCLTLAFGCKEDCEKFNTTEWCFENNTSDGISVSVDGSFKFELATGQSDCVTLSGGVHEMTAFQTNGFTFPVLPWTWEDSQDLIICRSVTSNLIR